MECGKLSFIPLIIWSTDDHQEIYTKHRSQTGFNLHSLQKNRILPSSLMPTGKSQAKNIWIIPETRFTEFPALSVDRSTAISWSAVKTDDRLFFLSIIGKMVV